MLSKIVNLVSAFLVASIASTMVLQVFQRFVMNNSLPWPDELVGNLLVALAMVGGILAMRDGEHIRVRVLWYTLPQPYVNILRVTADIASVGFLLLVAWVSWPSVVRMWRVNLTTLEVPVGLFLSTVPVCFVIMAYYVIRRSVITGPKHLED
ncbi:MAG: TRAP transporter small permease [Sedimentitalea sp.]|uniref:TRAP transporter small permease n=1 Tax=Sedimentitalea sp. TaxID=2048915 RepID=UPI00326667B0